MKSRGLFIAAALLAGAAAHANDAGQALAQRSVCLACHQVDAKRVGPSFRTIALRYAGNEAAAEYLARTIRDGSRGLWGAIPMPAQRHVDPATALLLAEWIMSLAPDQNSAPAAADGGTSAAPESSVGGAAATGSDGPHQAASPASSATGDAS